MTSNNHPHRPKRPSLWWRLRASMDRAFRRIGKLLGSSAEAFEWTMHRMLRLLMPWTWFQSRADDYEREFPRNERPNVVESFESVFQRQLEFLSRLLMPWRWFAKQDRTTKAAETITGERSASVAEAFEWRMGRLFETVGDFASTFYRIIVPRKVAESTADVRRALTKTTLGAAEKIRRRIRSFVERLLPKRFFWPLYRLADSAWYLFDFVGEWWWSREFGRLTWAIPAILLTVPVGVSMVFAVWNSTPYKIQRYQSSLAKAEEVQDEQTAVLVKRRLEQLGYQRLDLAEFSTAMALVKEERFAEAYERLRPIAPRNKPRLLEAHLWIASAIMSGQIDPAELEPLELHAGSHEGKRVNSWEVFAAHVSHALSLDRENTLARRFRVELLIHQGRRTAAIAEMEPLLDEYPDFHATLAHEYSSLGDQVKARQHARRAVTHFGNLAKAARESTENESSVFTAKGCLRMAEAYHLINEPDQELEMLKTGIRHFPDNRDLQSAFVDARVSRLWSLAYDDSQLLVLMEDICRDDKDNMDVVRVLARGILAQERPNAVAKVGLDLSSLGGQDRQTVVDSAWKILRHLEENDLLSSDVFERIGNFHLVQEDFLQATDYLKRACRLNPDASQAWNNLAWLLGRKPMLDLTKALAAANRAIALKSDPRFLETRAQILIKMESWADAAQDLETAIAGTIPNAIDAHRSLAACYAALGQVEQAAAHRAIADSVRN